MNKSLLILSLIVATLCGCGSGGGGGSTPTTPATTYDLKASSISADCGTSAKLWSDQTVTITANWTGTLPPPPASGTGPAATISVVRLRDNAEAVVVTTTPQALGWSASGDSYRLTCTVDSASQVSETDEGNNVTSQVIAITPERAGTYTLTRTGSTDGASATVATNGSTVTIDLVDTQGTTSFWVSVPHVTATMNLTASGTFTGTLISRNCLDGASSSVVHWYTISGTISAGRVISLTYDRSTSAGASATATATYTGQAGAHG